ncbi:MAG: T9SS type A sorting domain-containing protein, partial [Crocinitomicaceae bacterium]
GVGVSDDPEVSFYPANRGYNVTQFYGIAFDRTGAVLGGTQDNGSLYNDHSLSTWLEFVEVSGGDGFQCEISFFNPQIMFTTSQYGSGMRSTDGGSTVESFVPNPLPATYDPFGTDGSANHPFHTKIYMAEHFDLNSEDSVVYFPNANYAVGETIPVPSAASGDTINYTLTEALYYSDTVDYNPALSVTETGIVDSASGQNVFLDLYTWAHVGTSGSGLTPPIVGDSLLVTYPSGISDTVVTESVFSYERYYANNPAGGVYDMGLDSVIYNLAWNNVTVQDPFQSWYFMYVNANGGELWGTRNALRLSAQDEQWGIVIQGIGSSNVDVEFSKDLNNIYISSGGSVVRRLDGLGSVYTSSSTFAEDAFYRDSSGTILAPNSTSVTTFNPGGQVEGICVNPSDANDVVVVTGFGTNNIKRSLNAASAAPSFSNVGSIPGNPGTYDAIIDREDDQVLVIGTSHGVFVTEDGGSSWEDGSIGFCGTPVFEVRQSWRTWAEGNFRPGEIYIGTFGRGIWSTSSFLSTNDDMTDGNGGTSIDEFDTNLFPYPNPTSASTSLTFELANTSDVSIQVYNLSGRRVKSINKKNMSQGSQVVDIEGADLATGTYIVKLFAGKQEATTKFVKM